jgi:DMSO/TMAO reductase YedYZ molybdopterin-dependent catalytic subunit
MKDNPRNLSRRQFLQSSGMLIGGVLLGSISGCPSPGRTSIGPPLTSMPGVIYSPDTTRTNRIPPGQHEVTDWPVLQAGGVQRIDAASWNLRLFGSVPDEIILTFSDFSALTQSEVFSDIHCVTRWSRLGNLWEGVTSHDIIALAHPAPDAGYVIAHAGGGFTANIPLAEFLKEDVILAVKHDGQPLSAEHGGPVRLVVPQLYFWKSAKWLTGLEFTPDDRPGFWERAGYHNHGDPWTEERFA